MAASIYPKYPPDLTKAQFDHLITSIKDYSIAHGLAVRPQPSFVPPESDPAGVLATTAPVTLFPSLFPRACFDEAKAIQKAYNELYASIANDEEWLKDIVEELAEVDDFIAKLWKVHLAVKEEGYTQDLSLGLFRSDYLVHVEPSNPSAKPEVKQVEFNTIASSFGGLSEKVGDLHRYLYNTSCYPPTPSSSSGTASNLINTSSLTPNHTISSLSSGLAAAHDHYGPSKTSNQKCIIFLVQDPERNVFDQRPLEYTLQVTHSIPTFRVPFSSILLNTSIDNTHSSRPLLYTPPHSPESVYEVSVVYFRAGYALSDYPDETAWTARHQVERSCAIKCPTILTHLAGSKKIQQVLATPSSPHLSRFLKDPAVADRVHQTFTNIYPIDDTNAGREARAIATDEGKSNGYVLKPQREGGGNNIYRAAIPKFLKSLPESHWKGYILMELIEPPAQENAILRNGEVQRGQIIGELGIYGACLWRKGENSPTLLENEEAGQLLRTKGRESEEGGVAAGFGSVDSCLLIDV
ncbi:glutathione synthetase-like protein [Xylona heveae TC161]|uniref:Glutathione synthetase n=1 Tax=Xylona heveae (strain CBS 132557 / TC161) TaxID=1328760 RepID=A0A165GJ48_XYLHT|nr:glutathione synthetase-like protein [Xylona heveae TC161]KZF22249.1 glutathione synthetase-like protein [Xylona heveae TC161]